MQRASDFTATRLLRRAGYGARPADDPAVSAETWLAGQLQPPAGPDPSLGDRLHGLELDVGLDALAQSASMREMRRSPEARRSMRRRSQQIAGQVSAARVVRAVHSDWPLREVMVDFWSNHLSVDRRKGIVGALLAHYESEVLRRHALGRYEDLLLASAKSPAMLLYLDNWRSFAEHPLFPKRGLNENYARELLELHTVGLDAGYTQDDVVAVARVLSGWSLARREPAGFRFRPRVHDGRRVRVMGEPVPGEGIERGEALLRRLARHPATARHLATKLVRRFVDDAPPRALVARATDRYLEREGDIAAVLELVLEAPAFRDPTRRKFQTPWRWWVESIRSTGGRCDGGRPTQMLLARLGEAPFRARSPAGYPEVASSWIDPGAMIERIGAAFALARGAVRGSALGTVGAVAEPRAIALCTPEALWT